MMNRVRLVVELELLNQRGASVNLGERMSLLFNFKFSTQIFVLVPDWRKLFE